MGKIRITTAACLLIWGQAQSQAQAQDALDGPFELYNQNPLVAIHALPGNSGTGLTRAGSFAGELNYSVASHFEIDTTNTEQIVLDGETERLGLRLRYGLNPRWEAGVEIPLVRQRGGYLDDLIIDWHDWFDLPQNGRDQAPQDRLEFAYSGPGDAVVLRDKASGVGDVRLSLARKLLDEPARSSTLRAYVKLPTGDERKLLGSGGVDVGVSFHHRQLLTENLTVNLWGGLAYLSDGDVLPQLVRNWVVTGGAAVALRVSQLTSLKVQWDASSQVYKRSRLPQLNEVAYMLSFGGSVRISPASYLDIVVVENYPHPQITPDVAFQLGWRWQPGG